MEITKHKQDTAQKALTQFGYKSTLAAPRLTKIVISSGTGSGMKKDRTKNELDLIGWFDLDNCFNIIWDRGDIAQAFSNLHGFGNVLNLETEIYDVRDGFSGQPPESREYFKAVLDQVDE